MILIKGSIAIGSPEGMRFLTDQQRGGYPLLSFDNWDALAEWGKEKESKLDSQVVDEADPTVAI